MTAMPHVLVVAGSDSSGGAGIVRDIETLAAFGVKASVAITAITVQTHHGVEHADPVAPERVAQQMRAALSANPIAAIKIGMLATAATICAFAQVLADHPGIPVVLDPVLVSTSGRALLDPDATEALPGLFFRVHARHPQSAGAFGARRHAGRHIRSGKIPSGGGSQGGSGQGRAR